MIRYFSYGSNMSLPRLLARAPSASRIATGLLKSHSLRFHKFGQDGSAKCDALQTGDPEHYVIGVLFEIDRQDKTSLDRVEGLGQGYAQKDVCIELPGGETVAAFTYYATHTAPGLQPYSWYLEHVLRGARQNTLPGEYIRMIEAVVALTDPDPARHEQELSIYV